MAFFFWISFFIGVIAILFNPKMVLDDGSGIICLFLPFVGTIYYIYCILDMISSHFDKYGLANYNFGSMRAQASCGKIDVATITGCAPPYDPFVITYEQFVKFYSINPVKWHLTDEGYLTYLPDDDESEKTYVAVFNSNKEYKQALKYYFERKEEMKKDDSFSEFDRDTRQNTIEVLKDIQQDVDKLRAQSDNEIEKVYQDARKIAIRLK